MKTAALALAALAAVSGSALAAEGPRPKGIPHLDHVFVIMMENHGYQQVINNPNEPYLNQIIANKTVNLATNYFAIGHPSLTNYLEVVGGSNFGVRSDAAPNWHNTTCQTNLATGMPNADNGGGNAPIPIDTGTVCPIAGSGMDAATDAIDNWNEVTPPYFNFLANIDGIKSVAAASTDGKTIADQLAQAGKSWKSYQESLPVAGADGVNYSNGTSTNLTNFASLAPLTSGSVVQDYAVKHNPFAYFKSVQDGTDPELSLARVVGFDGAHGLYADLASGNVPDFAFIAPNQCNDQHGRGNADAYCAFDPGLASLGGLTNGTQVGLNPGLIQQGDTTIQRLVTSIKASHAWTEGRNAIVVVWDENDYSGAPALQTSGPPFLAQNTNNVVLTVETNYQGSGKGISSSHYYNSFSLLKSLESGLDLPCLNHACDSDVSVMSDLFGAHGDD
jgi:phosphatidylinositol-3-phosphatase